MIKDRKIKLKTHFYEIKVHLRLTTATLPISPKMGFVGVGQDFLKVKTHKVTPYFEDLDKRRTNSQWTKIMKMAEIEGSS